MSSKNIRTCDRCGETIAHDSFPVVRVTRIKSVAILGFGEHNYDSNNYDLCPACSRSFVLFMQNKPARIVKSEE